MTATINWPVIVGAAAFGLTGVPAGAETLCGDMKSILSASKETSRFASITGAAEFDYFKGKLVPKGFKSCYVSNIQGISSRYWCVAGKGQSPDVLAAMRKELDAAATACLGVPGRKSDEFSGGEETHFVTTPGLGPFLRAKLYTPYLFTKTVGNAEVELGVRAKP